MIMLNAHRALPAVLLATAVMMATPACAAQSGYYRIPQGSRVLDNRAFDQGYREGFEHGRDDARRNRPFDYSRHREYRNANQGYRGGNPRGYRNLYRDGFVNGYNDAYRQFARGDRRGSPYPSYGRAPYPGQDGRFRSPALQNGYRDGYAQGRDDGRDGDRYDPIRANRYREGDHDYNSRYGSRDQYKLEYREAFKQGYDQGYREVRR
jgi:hypothetical protein